jgi:HPt (histidine-containing phosphotransfer) domain-containing protein
MNDHIAKPIRVAEMFSTLARWVRPKSSVAVPPRPATAFELPGLDSQGALVRLAGDEQLYRRLLEMFRDRESEFGENFRSAYATGDVTKAARLAHDLKSVSGTVGAQALSEAAHVLEHACLQGARSIEVDALLETVCGQLDPVIDGLRAIKSGAVREMSSR